MDSERHILFDCGSQEQLNELYEPWEFETPKSFGELHAVLFVVLAICRSRPPPELKHPIGDT